MEARRFSTILVPHDGSAAADAALCLALRLVDRDGEIVIAHAIDRDEVVAESITPYGGDPGPAFEVLEAEEREIFAAAQVRIAAAGIRCATVAFDGSAPSCIAALASGHGVDAIAMGTHGRRGIARLILGNTAADVLDDVAVPAFVLHDRTPPADGPFRQILVALDASIAGRSAACEAVELAARHAASVLFAHVAEDGRDERGPLAYGEAFAAQHGVGSECALLYGDAAEAILLSAETCGADLIALGAHRRPRRSRLGSVAEAILRLSHVPVLVMPFGAGRSSPAVPEPSAAGAAGGPAAGAVG